VVDVLVALYRRALRIVPAEPRHPGRDRLILSKGHAAIALYAVLRRVGYFEDPLDGYAGFASPLEGHPDMTRLPGVDFSTGSLGQGLSVGLGAALALRDAGARVWVVLGDGECQEGQVWEAAMLAAQLGAGNLRAVIDHNRFQEWGWRDAAPPVDQLADKWRAFGWRVREVDGHDLAALEAAVTDGDGDGPSLLIAHTIKGKGVPLVEAAPGRFHCDAVTADEHAAIVRSLAR
jgi:transketolase